MANKQILADLKLIAIAKHGEGETELPEYKLFRGGKTAFERYKSLTLLDFTESQKNVLTALMKMAFLDGVDMGLDSPEEASKYRED